jgi:hypothetical protein
MHFSFRDDWRELKRSRPGHRFRDRFERAQRTEPQGGIAKRIALMALAGICLLVGLFFAVFPGPAIPFFLIGGALLAAESRAIAGWMDWIEVHVRKILMWLIHRWRDLPSGGRVIVAVGAMSCLAVFGYFAYRWLRD